MTKPTFMQASKKAAIIAVGAVLVAAFFMPWFDAVFIRLSAWDIVFGDVGQMLKTPVRFIAALIPTAGLLVIYGAAFNSENYPLPKQFLFLLPVLTLLAIAIIIYVETGDYGRLMRNIDFESFIKIFGIGFWLTQIASIILPFLRGRKPA